mmetsp:Transcript_79962/g.258603  ORF Transcript_79962/g.258603 Transcript_79962/m.258603 type:complete len:216 (+) Transcript_79962:176-823(+)
MAGARDVPCGRREVSSQRWCAGPNLACSKWRLPARKWPVQVLRAFKATSSSMYRRDHPRPLAPLACPLLRSPDVLQLRWCGQGGGSLVGGPAAPQAQDSLREGWSRHAPRPASPPPPPPPPPQVCGHGLRQLRMQRQAAAWGAARGAQGGGPAAASPVPLTAIGGASEMELRCSPGRRETLVPFDSARISRRMAFRCYPCPRRGRRRDHRLLPSA